MSIATRTGDDGTTGLMYHRRLSKSHPRVEAYGSVDELNAALGMVRAHSTQPMIRDLIKAVQEDLIPLMGVLATADQDQERYFVIHARLLNDREKRLLRRRRR
jgi:cob(I)alamin adenosyltransferase